MVQPENDEFSSSICIPGILSPRMGDENLQEDPFWTHEETPG
jgi:hypothetical protein